MEEKDKLMTQSEYKERAIVVSADQWFKNGDHPEDDCGTFMDSETGLPFIGEGHIVRYYRHPSINGQTKCPHCEHIMHDHGWIEESGCVVCPGDWIVRVNDVHYSVKRGTFEALYSELHESSNVWNLLSSVRDVPELAEWVSGLSQVEIDDLFYKTLLYRKYGVVKARLLERRAHTLSEYSQPPLPKGRGL